FVGFLMVAFIAILALLIVALPFVTGLFGPAVSILPHDPNELLPCAIPTECATPPSAQYWFGTDNVGRDMFSRVLAALPLDLAIKHLPYVAEARAAGVSGIPILFRHVFRNILEPLVVYYTMDVGTVIVTFSTISFIGIGVPPTVPEWGGMVEAYEKLLLTAPWTVLAPGAAIFLTVLAFSLLGDGLRD